MCCQEVGADAHAGCPRPWVLLCASGSGRRPSAVQLQRSSQTAISNLLDGCSTRLKDNSWMHEVQLCSLLEGLEDPELRACSTAAAAVSMWHLPSPVPAWVRREPHVSVLQEQGLLC